MAFLIAHFLDLNDVVQFYEMVQEKLPEGWGATPVLIVLVVLIVLYYDKIKQLILEFLPKARRRKAAISNLAHIEKLLLIAEKQETLQLNFIDAREYGESIGLSLPRGKHVSDYGVNDSNGFQGAAWSVYQKTIASVLLLVFAIVVNLVLLAVALSITGQDATLFVDAPIFLAAIASVISAIPIFLSNETIASFPKGTRFTKILWRISKSILTFSFALLSMGIVCSFILLYTQQL